MPLGKEACLGPGHIGLHGDPVGTQPPQQPLPNFRSMCIVAKRSPISATAEFLWKRTFNYFVCKCAETYTITTLREVAMCFLVSLISPKLLIELIIGRCLWNYWMIRLM